MHETQPLSKPQIYTILYNNIHFLLSIQSGLSAWLGCSTCTLLPGSSKYLILSNDALHNMLPLNHTSCECQMYFLPIIHILRVNYILLLIQPE